MKGLINRRGAMLAAACALSLGAANLAAADQAFEWQHTWWYIWGPDFDDFHATYTGTGGSIDREVLTVDTAGGGLIGNSMNTIDIWWPDTWVVPGDVFQYEFNTAFPEVAFNSATITKGGEVIGFVDPQGIIRDAPGNQIGALEHSFHQVPAPGALVLLGAAGIVARRRRVA